MFTNGRFRDSDGPCIFIPYNRRYDPHALPDPYDNLTLNDLNFKHTEQLIDKASNAFKNKFINDLKRNAEEINKKIANLAAKHLEYDSSSNKNHTELKQMICDASEKSYDSLQQLRSAQKDLNVTINAASEESVKFVHNITSLQQNFFDLAEQITENSNTTLRQENRALAEKNDALMAQNLIFTVMITVFFILSLIMLISTVFKLKRIGNLCFFKKKASPFDILKYEPKKKLIEDLKISDETLSDEEMNAERSNEELNRERSTEERQNRFFGIASNIKAKESVHKKPDTKDEHLKMQKLKSENSDCPGEVSDETIYKEEINAERSTDDFNVKTCGFNIEAIGSLHSEADVSIEQITSMSC